MNIEKEREAFEAWFLNKYQYSAEYFQITKFDADRGFYTAIDHYNPDSVNSAWVLRSSFDSWQAAKAKAVPEGFVLIKASDRDQEMLELIDQRDHMESQAEELKDKLQALYGVDFGEHSSCNFPFQNAIDYEDSDLVLVEKAKLMQIVGSAAIIEPITRGNPLMSKYKTELDFILSTVRAMIEAQEQNQ